MWEHLDGRPCISKQKQWHRGLPTSIFWKGLDPLFYNLNKETKRLTSLPTPMKCHTLWSFVWPKCWGQLPPLWHKHLNTCRNQTLISEHLWSPGSGLLKQEERTTAKQLIETISGMVLIQRKALYVLNYRAFQQFWLQKFPGITWPGFIQLLRSKDVTIQVDLGYRHFKGDKWQKYLSVERATSSSTYDHLKRQLENHHPSQSAAPLWCPNSKQPTVQNHTYTQPHLKCSIG